MKIATVIGTRPEIIKLSQLVPLLDKEFEHTFVFTGQHYSKFMADIFFEQLKVRKPDVFLGVESSDIGLLTDAIKKELKKINPAYVLVYGDTNSTLAAALAAKELNMKIIHVEAGLRCFDDRVPEERNRVQVDKMSDYLFPPTELAKKFLNTEGITKNVFVVGNTVVDACLKYIKQAVKPANLDAEAGEYILATVHRQENVDYEETLRDLLEIFRKINKKIVFPVHPRTGKNIEKFKLSMPENVSAIGPVGYFEMLWLIKNAKLVITDSGGVQEEAITLHAPCLTIRGANERWETIMAGGNFLITIDPFLVAHYVKMICDSELGERMKKAKNPYGEGNISRKIVEILKRELK